MPRPRSRPALDGAVAFLRALIARSRPGARVPGVRELATRADVSLVTMWKAVQILASSGLLRTIAERQILVGPAAGAPVSEALRLRVPSPPPAVPRWRILADEIASDLLALRLGLGPSLPSAKELCARYGVARLTLGRALRWLERDGRVRRHGRRFALRQAPAKRATNVVFVGEQPGGDVLTDLAPRSLELWRALETSCRRRGVRLLSRSAEAYLQQGPTLVASENVAGYVVRNLDVPEETAGRLLQRLFGDGRPVALVDEVGQAPPRVPAARFGLLRTFAIAHGTRAGRDVGRALVELGHRRVAVFSPFTEPWSRQRIAGLADALRDAASGSGLVAYVAPRFSGDPSVRGAVTSARGWPALVRRTESFRRRLDPGRGDTPPLRDPSFSALAADAVAGSLRPLFERALLRRDTTAWVGVNDVVALAALRFLREAARSVPGDLAVVGFDDTTDALRAGLSSYDFNLPAVAEALVDHALGWSPRTGCGRRSAIEIPGALVERESLGPPRQPPGWRMARR